MTPTPLRLLLADPDVWLWGASLGILGMIGSAVWIYRRDD